MESRWDYPLFRVNQSPRQLIGLVDESKWDHPFFTTLNSLFHHPFPFLPSSAVHVSPQNDIDIYQIASVVLSYAPHYRQPSEPDPRARPARSLADPVPLLPIS